MFEVNPVLAGKFDAEIYAPARSNNVAAAGTSMAADSTTGSTAGTNSVDDRRYTKFDRSASQVGTAEMSFSDVLDAVNPLQHIPLVSTVYRGITNQPINPIARVAGDILYGGVFGIGSALLGTIGSIGDSMMISQTGHSMAGTVMASLFGSDGATAAPGSPTDNVPTSGSTVAPILLADNPASTASTLGGTAATGTAAAGAPMMLADAKLYQTPADSTETMAVAAVDESDDVEPHYATQGAPVIMAAYAPQQMPVKSAEILLADATQSAPAALPTALPIETLSLQAKSSYVSAAALAMVPAGATDNAPETSVPDGPVSQAPAEPADVQVSTTVATPSPETALTPSTTAAEPLFGAARSYPINLNKQPYGGVMDTSSMSPLAKAAAQDPHATQMGYTIYPTRTSTAPRLVPTVPLTAPAPQPVSASTASPPPLPALDATTAATLQPATTPPANNNDGTIDAAIKAASAPPSDAIPKSLIDDLVALREFKKQPPVATPAGNSTAPAPRGSLIDLKN